MSYFAGGMIMCATSILSLCVAYYMEVDNNDKTKK